MSKLDGGCVSGSKKTADQDRFEQHDRNVGLVSTSGIKGDSVKADELHSSVLEGK
jgi:hypothetical protein